MAANVTITFVVTGDNPATSAQFLPAGDGNFDKPPSGTVVGAIAVTPADWTGTFTPSSGEIVVVPSGSDGIYNVQTVGALPAADYAIQVRLDP